MRTRKIPVAGDRSNPGIIRRMANSERKFLHIPSANIAVCARLRGPVRAEDIRKGIDAAARIHPLLAAKVVMGSPEEANFIRGDPSAIPLRVCPRDSDAQWFDEVVHEHMVPFDPFTGPLSRFVLLTSGDVSDLIIFCQHAISDGSALVLLMRDILAHACGTAVQSSEISPPMITDLIPKEKTGLVKRFVRGYSMGIINKSWQKHPWLFDHEDFLAIHRAFWEKYAYRIVTLELDGDDAERLLAACREHNVTVGSAVTVAFLAAWQDMFREKGQEREEKASPGKKSEMTVPRREISGVRDAEQGYQEAPEGGGRRAARGNPPRSGATDRDYEGRADASHEYTIVLPYDLRNRLDNPVGDVFSLFVGSIQLRTAYDRGQSFWENCKRFHGITREKMNAREFLDSLTEIERFDPTLMDALMSYTLYAADVEPDDPRYDKLSRFAAQSDNIAHILAGRTLGLLPDMISTNLGRVKIPESFGKLKLERCWFAPSASTSPLVLGGIGSTASMTFTVNILAEKGGEPERIRMMETVRDRALEYLTLR